MLIVTVLVAYVQVYRHCSHIDISGLKDPRLHEQTIISALYNLGRLLDDDGRHQVPLLTSLLTYSFMQLLLSACYYVKLCRYCTLVSLSNFIH